MSAAIETARTDIRPNIGRGHPTVVGIVLVIVAATLLVGPAALSTGPAGTRSCLPRVGCEQGVQDSGGLSPRSIEASFSAAGPEIASAIWFGSMIEPASPTMEHLLNPAASTSFAFEPTSPALEHFQHPVPVGGAWPSSAFEPVSPVLEHFLHQAG